MYKPQRINFQTHWHKNTQKYHTRLDNKNKVTILSCRSSRGWRCWRRCLTRGRSAAAAAVESTDGTARWVCFVTWRKNAWRRRPRVCGCWWWWFVVITLPVFLAVRYFHLFLSLSSAVSFYETVGPLQGCSELFESSLRQLFVRFFADKLSWI